MAGNLKARLRSKSLRSIVLRELRSLSEERKSQHENIVGRFLQCRELQLSSALVAKAVDRCSRWCEGKRLLPRHDQCRAFEAANSHLGLTSLEEIKAEQRFLADDSEAITLAEIFGWTSVTTRVVGSSFWGEPLNRRNPRKRLRLRTVAELFP